MNKRALIYLPKPGKLGGIETHAVRLTKLLLGNGWSVTLVATGNSLHRALKSQLEEAGAIYWEIDRPSETGGFLSSLWFIGKFLARHLFARWDLVYTNGQTS